MLGLNQVRAELKAIESFDRLFLADGYDNFEEGLAYLFRQVRKKELLEFVRAVTVGN